MTDPISILFGIFIGFFAGFCYSKRKTMVPSTTKKEKLSNGESESESESEEEIVYSDTSDLKMVFVVRQDLKMGKGKSAAQCCHAAIDIFRKAKKRHPEWLQAWETTGCAKVALKCPDEETLLAIASHARVMGLDSSVIQDAGRTQIASGSKTVVGIGPAPVDVIDKVTGHLKLF